MKLGAYQFAVTGNIKHNLETIKKGVLKAADAGVKLLVFPECALTGYPPRDFADCTAVNFEEVKNSCEQLQELAKMRQMYLIVGTVTQDRGKYYNSAVVISPEGILPAYHKRALWGWDRDHFSEGLQNGIVETAGVRIGIRICFEIRFPEFFRELYREKTELDIVLFYDVSDEENPERYELMKSHIRTRAVENVCHILSVNATAPCQTAPTALIDRSGKVLAELNRNEEALLFYDLSKTPYDFGEQGRKTVSDTLMQTRPKTRR